MPLKELIAEHGDDLTTSDRRLLDVLLVDRTEGSFLPAREIAQRAGVHASTAGRLARKVCLVLNPIVPCAKNCGMRCCRISMPPARVRKRLDRATGQTVLQSVIEGEVRALSTLASQVDQSTIDSAIAMLRVLRVEFSSWEKAMPAVWRKFSSAG